MAEFHRRREDQVGADGLSRIRSCGACGKSLGLRFGLWSIIAIRG